MKTRKALALGTAALAAVFLVLWLTGALRGGIAGLVRDSNAPYGRFAVWVRNVLSGSFSALEDAAGIRAENASLHAEVEELRAQMIALGETERENAALRRALGLKQKERSLVGAEVTSRGEGYGWWNVVRIDKGREDGITQDCPVISTAGLVGRVVAVTDDTADVLLLSDANSKVSCYIEGEEAGARGVLTGMGVQKGGGELDLLHVVEPMSLSYISKELDVKEGARILTSGIGGLYPAGLPVGEVVATSDDASRLYQRAKVAPYVDFASLRRVFVMRAVKPAAQPHAAGEAAQ